jgi:NAD(P)H-flavin reductase
MISIAGPPNGEYLDFSILLQGNVTSRIQTLEKGDKIALRGPYGNCFPVDDWKGKNIIIVGGGIGIAPLRSIYGYVLRNRNNYSGLSIFYGARDSASLVYKQEFYDIMKEGTADVRLSIDKSEPGWKGFVGFVVANLAEAKPSPANSIAITCGPPIHIKVTLEKLKQFGFTDDQIFTTLERKMKCGFGKCGRCNLGHTYTCTRGPVFSLKELRGMPPEGLPDQ